MKENIIYGLVRVLICTGFGSIFVILPKNQDEFGQPVYTTTEQKIWIMGIALVIATIWVMCAYLSLRKNIKLRILYAKKIIEGLHNNEQWKNYQSTLEEVKKKWGHLQDCKTEIERLESEHERISRWIPYMETEWQQRTPPLSFLGMAYDSWLRDHRILRGFSTDIGKVYTILSDIHRNEAQFQAASTKIKDIMRDMENLPAGVLRVIAPEVTRVKTEHKKIEMLFENATRLDIKKQAIREMEAFQEQVTEVLTVGEVLQRCFKSKKQLARA